jgi:hypothetical protein
MLKPIISLFNVILEYMTTFSNKLLEVGKEAADAIEDFMKDKEQYWVDGYVATDAPISEDQIKDEWPKFYNSDYLNSLVSIGRDVAGGIVIYAILQMRGYDPELQDYQLDALSTECVCSIADDLSLYTKTK